MGFTEDKGQITAVKYFFLSEGWTYSRVWEFGGLWNENNWRRKPEIKRLNCGILQQAETLWLYEVEDAVLMIEIEPENSNESSRSIGQVVLKRLINAEQVIEILTKSDSIFHHSSDTRQSN
jgi:hypothetical protein